MSRHVVVTGAAGFLGQQVVRALLADPGVAQVTASDRAPLALQHPRLGVLTCALDDPALQTAVRQADAVIHLAAILGGAAEGDPRAARAVNVDATLDLAAACRRGARFVFASSLAVLGASVDARAPVMVYGAHKAMVEIALETATRRGEIDALSLRPGGIVARPDAGEALRSAFMSRVFWAVARGQSMTLPVSAQAQTWMASAPVVAGQFVHAALMADPGPVRSLTLPMTRCSFGALVDALRAAFPESRAVIDFAPEADMMALFGHAQPLDFSPALSAGFRPDADLAALVTAALQTGDPA